MRRTLRKRSGKQSSWHEPNINLVGLIIVLLVFGLVMLSSASIVESLQNKGTPYYYLSHQLLYGVLIGLPVCWLLSMVDYHIWKKYAVLLLVISLILALLVLESHIGQEWLGARRWLNIGGIILQPSELIKLTFLIYLGAWLESKKDELHTLTGLLPFLIMLTVVAILVAIIQSDLGTMVVISIIALTGYFIAKVPWKHMLIISGLGLIIFTLMVGVLPVVMPNQFAYRRDRITIFLNLESDKQGAGYQVSQSLLAVGSGGLLGLGYSQSRQKWNLLPESAADSIFAVIAEEMGFIVTAGLVVLYSAIMWQGFKITRTIPDIFGKVLAGGITTWITFQAFVNIMAMIGLLPLTGIPLPLISYGSTSLITLLGAIGILINISRQTE
ncbi:MAG: putative peptidoglycan glycosyltransferase FtsW [Patescibacteria group bacterium]|jgi:cell division protein FtsW